MNITKKEVLKQIKKMPIIKVREIDPIDNFKFYYPEYYKCALLCQYTSGLYVEENVCIFDLKEFEEYLRSEKMCGVSDFTLNLHRTIAVFNTKRDAEICKNFIEEIWQKRAKSESDLYDEMYKLKKHYEDKIKLLIDNFLK